MISEIADVSIDYDFVSGENGWGLTARSCEGAEVVGSAATKIVVCTRGEGLAGAAQQVRAEVAQFLAARSVPWYRARIRLTRVTHSHSDWEVLAQANLELNAHIIRAQVGAESRARAIHLLRGRLDKQLSRLADPQQCRPWPPVGPRPDPIWVPAPDRRVSRTKRYWLTRCDVDRAALLMDLGDYDFYLFTEEATGLDAVVYRIGPTGYRLARMTALAPPRPRTSLPLTVNVHPTPLDTPAGAANRLNETELNFRFFCDTKLGRGAVVYRRYDGHYALITPVAINH